MLNHSRVVLFVRERRQFVDVGRTATLIQIFSKVLYLIYHHIELTELRQNAAERLLQLEDTYALLGVLNK